MVDMALIHSLLTRSGSRGAYSGSASRWGPCSRAMRISSQITYGKDVTPWAKASTRNIVPSA